MEVQPVLPVTQLALPVRWQIRTFVQHATFQVALPFITLQISSATPRVLVPLTIKQLLSLVLIAPLHVLAAQALLLLNVHPALAQLLLLI